MAIEIAGGSSHIVVRYLPLMLEGTARAWIDNLPEKSIHSWYDMEKVFSRHFQGTYKRQNTCMDLQRCVQKPDETMTDFVSRWISEKANCHGVSDA